MLSFVGRLIDVQSGQVLASFQVGSAANWNLPMDYTAEVTPKKGGKILQGETFPYYHVDQRGAGEDDDEGHPDRRAADRRAVRRAQTFFAAGDDFGQAL
jgi:hypothetical protein